MSQFSNFLNAPELIISSESYPLESFVISEKDIEVDDFELPRDIMLGKQAEICFETYLRNSPRFKIIAANVQIQGANETLGELDYIVLDTISNDVLHIELACKFYLYDLSIPGSIENKWIGPNRKDSLAQKLTKLKDKQFPLLYASETANRLAELPIDIASVIQQLCLKAFLFIPKRFDKKQLLVHYRNCVMGYYINFSEFTASEAEMSYAIPTKQEWLLPTTDINTWYSFSEAKKIIQEKLKSKRSPLIYKKSKTKIEHFFVPWWA